MFGVGSKDPKVVEKFGESLQKIEAELEFAEEAKGWIDHRRAPIRWLMSRADSAASIDPAILKEGL